MDYDEQMNNYLDLFKEHDRLKHWRDAPIQSILPSIGSVLFVFQQQTFTSDMPINILSSNDILSGHTYLHLMYTRKKNIRSDLGSLHTRFTNEMKRRGIEHISFDNLDNL